MSRSPRRLIAILGALVATLSLAGTAIAAPAPDTARAPDVSHDDAAASAARHNHNPLLKQVLAEDEDDDADAPDLTAQCAKNIGKPNPYKAIAPDVDMINGDNYAANGSSAGCFTAQNETTIASNPANPANIVSGTNDYRLYNSRESRNDSSGYAYTSMDGGITWKDVLLPGLTYQTGAVGALRAMDSAGDPVLSFGPNNTVYYGNIVFSRGAPADGGTEAPSAIVVSISHNGGLSFGKPKIVEIDGVDSVGHPLPTRVFNDKIWLAADPNGGRVYVTWTRFLDDKDGGYVESPIVISASSDSGATFSAERRIDTAKDAQDPGLQPYSQGSNPRVAPNGTLYVAYETSYCRTSACDRVGDRDVTVVATSIDHGRSFSRAVVATNYDFPFDDSTGSDGLTGENFRINSYPQLTVDLVTSQLLVTWADDRNGTYDADTGESIQSDGDNIVSSSINGRTWTAPTVVGSAQDEVFGAVASYNGTAAVVSYTRHYQPGTPRLDFAFWRIAATPGHRVTAGPIKRLTTQSSDPRVQFTQLGDDGKVLQGVFIGDYAAVSMGQDLRLHPAWTDFRGNPGTTTPNQDAYTRAVSLG